LFNLEQGWINIKEAITDLVGEAEFIGKVIGQVIAVTIRNVVTLQKNIIDGFLKATQPVVNFFQGLQESVGNVAGNIVTFFREAFQKLIDIIPEPLKKLLGGLEIPKLNLDIAIPELPNPFEALKEKLGELKEGTIEYFELEALITEENNKQLDAKNNIVTTIPKITTGVEQLSEAEKKAKEEAKEIEETFRKIGESVRNDLVSNLREAIKGSQSFGQAINKVLDRMKDKLLDMALNQAISGLGNILGGGSSKGFTGFLGGLFGKERGGSVSAGGAYVVGERGPEILQMGSKGGNIIPNSKVGAGNSVTNIVNVSVDASGSAVQGDDANATQLGQTIANVVKEVIIDEQRSGGLLT